MISRRTTATLPLAFVLTLVSCKGGEPTVEHSSQAVDVTRPAGSHSLALTPKPGYGGSATGHPHAGHSSRAGSGLAGHSPGSPSSAPNSARAQGSPAIASNQVEFYGGFGYGRWHGVQVGDSVPLTLNPDNASGQPMTVIGVTSTGDFTVTTDDCLGAVLPARHQCSLTITFRPTDTGLRKGVLTVTTSPGPAASTLPLTGTAVKPTPTADQTSSSPDTPQ